MARPTVEFSERTAEQLEKLETETAERIISKLDDVTWNPDHYLRALSERKGYRLRVGDYRVLIDWRREEELLFVREIGHRRNIYD